jgi:molybdenum cofactor cytidylyltransferase
MRANTMRVISLPGSRIPPRGVLAHDVRDPAQPGAILARKGHLLTDAQLSDLMARGVASAHVLVPDEGDLAEDEAATRLAETVAGQGVTCTPAHFGQVMFHAARRGFLRVDSAALDQVNSVPGVLLFTAEPDCPVDPGTPVGGVKCAPLLLDLQAIHTVGQAGAVIQVVPFAPARVALVAPGARLRGNAFEQARASLSSTLAWYGSRLEPVHKTDATLADVAHGLQQASAAGVDLIFAAGASATDPADLLFDGLRQAGGVVHQIGVPAEPGTACWIGQLGPTPVLGLASCELFGKPGALDLLLPRILSGQPLDVGLLRSIARGGLVTSRPSRIAPYHDAPEPA